MIQEYQMETAQFGRAQKTLRGHNSKFAFSGQFAFQNRLICGVFWSAESHIPIRAALVGS